MPIGVLDVLWHIQISSRKYLDKKCLKFEKFLKIDFKIKDM